MGKKGYISEFMGGGRIVSHGKIADLSKGFKLPSGNPFSVYVRPKYSVSTLDTVLTVRCSQDENLTEAPVPFNDWSPLAISEIAPNSELLKTNDVYWGSGSYEGGRTRHDSVAVHQCCSAHQDMDSRPPQQEKRPQNEHSVLGSVHQQRQ